MQTSIHRIWLLFLLVSGMSLLNVSAALAAPTSAFTGAGPDDVMRSLPVQRDAQALLLQQPAASTGLAGIWSQQLRRLSLVLQAIDRQQVAHAPVRDKDRCGALSWSRDPASPCAPFAAARHLLDAAYAGAQDYEKLRFPGIEGAFPSPTASAPLQGGSFIGPRGSRVLLINLGTKPIRVDVGHWAAPGTRLLQAWLPLPPNNLGAHLERRSIIGVRQPVTLPPESISVLG